MRLARRFRPFVDNKTKRANRKARAARIAANLAVLKASKESE